MGSPGVAVWSQFWSHSWSAGPSLTCQIKSPTRFAMSRWIAEVLVPGRGGDLQSSVAGIGAGPGDALGLARSYRC